MAIPRAAKTQRRTRIQEAKEEIILEAALDVFSVSGFRGSTIDQIAKCDPYHLIFSIWSTTQHYADFDVQVRAVLGDEHSGEGRFEDAARYLEQLFVDGLPHPAHLT